MRASKPKTISAGLVIWLLLLVLALTLILALLPINLQNIPGDWQITAAAPALPDAVPYSLLVNVILALRYLALASFLAVSGLIVLQRPRSWAGWLAAYAFLFMPLAFNLAGYTDSWPYPAPWGAILGLLAGIAQIIALGSFVLLIYIYPDGAFHPRWSAWLTGGLLVVTLGFFLAAQFFGADGSDTGWVFGMLALMALFLGGLASQLYRYRSASPAERRQNRGFVIALGLVIAWLLVNLLTSGTRPPILSLAALFFDLIVLCSLPVAVAYAILKQGLWNTEAGLSHRTVRIYFAGWGVALIAGLALLFLTGPKLAGMASQPVGDLVWDKPPIPMIVDTDLSMDDHLALLYLLQHPGVQIIAITVSGTGEVHCQPGVRNVLDILEMLDAPEIAVTCGRETPLAGDHAFPQAWREGADTLYGVDLPEGSRQPYPGDAVELIQSVLAGSPVPVTLVTLGPLTNPGEALQAHPELVEAIKRIFIMGGAVDTPGNVGFSGVGIDNQVAEWNVYIDPLSTNLVLRSGAPVTFIPLDATNYAPVTAAFLARLEGNRETPAARLAYDLMSARREAVLAGGVSFWDVLTAAAVMDGSLASYKIDGIVVEEAEGARSGQTRHAADGPRASYAVWADGPRFEDQFLQVLNHVLAP